jgi:hypothetical protein
MAGLNVLFLVVLLVPACVVGSLLAWKIPELFIYLLRFVAIASLIAVVVVTLFRWCVTDYLHMSYVEHAHLIGYLLFGTWCFLVGVPALLVRTDSMATGRTDSMGPAWTWIILVTFANGVWWLQPRFPTDTALRAHFRAHRPTFDTLIATFQADSQEQSAAHTLYAGLPNIEHSSPQRLHAYARLLRSLGIDLYSYGLMIDKDRLSLTYPDAEGFGAGNKGYVYMLNARVPKPLLGWWALPDDSVPEWYRTLAPPWYMFSGPSGVAQPFL